MVKGIESRFSPACDGRIVKVKSHFNRTKSMGNCSVIYCVLQISTGGVVLGFGEVVLKQLVQVIILGIHTSLTTLVVPSIHTVVLVEILTAVALDTARRVLDCCASY